MPLSVIQERVQKLKKEVAELQAASKEYHKTPRHSTMESNEQLRRELRLQQIIGELAQLTRQKDE